MIVAIISLVILSTGSFSPFWLIIFPFTDWVSGGKTLGFRATSGIFLGVLFIQRTRRYDSLLVDLIKVEYFSQVGDDLKLEFWSRARHRPLAFNAWQSRSLICRERRKRPLKSATAEVWRLHWHVYLHTPAADSLANEANGRHMMSLLSLCGFRHWSVIFPRLLFCLDSNSANDSLICALWCNSSSSSLPRKRTGVIAARSAQSGSPRRLNEGWRAASTLFVASTGLSPIPSSLLLNPQSTPHFLPRIAPSRLSELLSGDNVTLISLETLKCIRSFLMLFQLSVFISVVGKVKSNHVHILAMK